MGRPTVAEDGYGHDWMRERLTAFAVRLHETGALAVPVSDLRVTIEEFADDDS